MAELIMLLLFISFLLLLFAFLGLVIQFFVPIVIVLAVLYLFRRIRTKTIYKTYTTNRSQHNHSNNTKTTMNGKEVFDASYSIKDDDSNG